MKHHEIEAGPAVLLSAFWHMAHFVGNQAPDGVELTVLVGLNDLHPKRSFDALDGGISADSVGAVSEAENVTFIFRNVKLIFYFANDLLKYIFDRDEPSDSAKLVNHDSEVVSVAPEFTQQVIQALAFGNKNGWPQQASNQEFRLTTKFEQVLRQEDSDDIFALMLKHREARVCGVNDDAKQFIARRIYVDQVHSSGRNHHVPRGHFCHAEHTFQHKPGFRPYDIVVLGVRECFDQLSR